MKFNLKKFIIILISTFIIGNLFSFLSFDTSFYKSLEKPIDVPGIVFPIVWSILFLLMSISLYMATNNKENNTDSYIIYYVQLIINSLWTLFFFGFKLYLFSFFWIILIIISVIIMIINFYKKNKVSSLLQIPYLVWLIFASYLNFMIYYLN